MIQARVRSNAKSVSAQLKNIGPGLNGAVSEGTYAVAYRLLELIVHNATGRPGPEVQTGAYVKSWKVRRITSRAASTFGATTSFSVYTTSPQAARLEYGFMNRYDSLGRFYRQPPFPHIQPAVDQMRLEAGAILAGSINKRGNKIYGPLGAAGDFSINTETR